MEAKPRPVTGERRLSLSVVIPVRNEAENIRDVLDATAEALTEARVAFELVMVDDRSDDDTVREVAQANPKSGSIRCLSTGFKPGFGNAVHWGLRQAAGEIVAVMMGDGSGSTGTAEVDTKRLDRGRSE